MSTDDMAPENFVDPDQDNELLAQRIDDAAREHREVIREDLSTQDLIDEGEDAADMTPDNLERPVDDALHLDEPGEETIEDRIAQEEPDL
ncbi:hypothetical protein ACX1DX_11315 [Tessaracoccus sp. Y36]|uniref:hypothetical protein n=1 Tax=unclassified Tessaracoccus TaxID=2635419 RepID=UPI00096C618B|nr:MULTISPECIES: hypothetical protein [unclassified Tessaracoccus]MBB1510751.1 hypothetical protein [Tessaracoccus sp. MC1756]MCG6568380.1 hypothetical protein [Tessaracoccus sp. ZS01]OMG52786.1 hypothetical protein BJN44_12235 [Tessaracoccus sp. ZS01]